MPASDSSIGGRGFCQRPRRTAGLQDRRAAAFLGGWRGIRWQDADPVLFHLGFHLYISSPPSCLSARSSAGFIPFSPSCCCSWPSVCWRPCWSTPATAFCPICARTIFPPICIPRARPSGRAPVSAGYLFRGGRLYGHLDGFRLNQMVKTSMNQRAYLPRLCPMTSGQDAAP